MHQLRIRIGFGSGSGFGFGQDWHCDFYLDSDADSRNGGDEKMCSQQFTYGQ
jgi:hypothetical protein